MKRILMTGFVWTMLTFSVSAATGRVVLSNDTPQQAEQIEAVLRVDLTEQNGPLGAFTAQLNWDASVLSLSEVADGATTAFANPIVRSKSGQVQLSQFHVDGATGTLSLARVVFDVVGKVGEQTSLNISFDVLDQAGTFVSLLSDLQVQPATVMVEAPPVPKIPKGFVRFSAQIAEAGAKVEAEVVMDMSAVGLHVGAYAAQLDWDASVLKLDSVQDGTTVAFVKPQLVVGNDRVTFSNLNVQGESGEISLLKLVFEVIGTTGQKTNLDLSFNVLDQAATFASLLGDLQITPTAFIVGTAHPLDFDSSGTVDFPDFLVFATKFGTQSEDEHFDARCDIDSNGSIDFRDFVVFVQAFDSTQ